MSSRTDFWLGYPYAMKGSTTAPRSTTCRIHRYSELTLEHLSGSFCQLDEDTIVDLKEPQKLESFPLLGIDLVDTLDTHHERQLVLGRYVEAVALLRLPRKPYLLPLSCAVFLDIFLCASEDSLPLLLVLIYP